MSRSKGILRGAVLLSFSAVVFSVAGGCMKQTQHAPDVWAAVNGKEIKREEVDKYYRTRVNPEGQEPSQEEALSLKLNVLDELIYNEILLERAKKLGLEASDGEVEDKFTERKSPYTEDEFQDRKSTRLNSSHVEISYAVFCLKKKNTTNNRSHNYTQRYARAGIRKPAKKTATLHRSYCPDVSPQPSATTVDALQRAP